VDPRTGLDDVEKIIDPTGTRNPTPSVVQPVASRHTDYAIPAHEEYLGKNINYEAPDYSVLSGLLFLPLILSS
jgi:hypothetical protein